MLISDQKVRDSCFGINSNAYFSSELSNLIKRVDYRNEKSIGLILNQSLFGPYHLSYKALFAIEIIQLHLTAWGHYEGLYVLWELMLAGKFYNRAFCGLIDRIGDNNTSKDTLKYPLNVNFRTNSNFFSNNTFFINYLDENLRQVADSLRIEFFLDGIVATSKKQVFQIKNKNFVFYPIHRFFLSDEEYSSEIQSFDKDISGTLRYVEF